MGLFCTEREERTQLQGARLGWLRAALDRREAALDIQGARSLHNRRAQGVLGLAVFATGKLGLEQPGSSCASC